MQIREYFTTILTHFFCLLIAAAFITGCADGSDDIRGLLKPTPSDPLVTGPIVGGGADDCCIITFGSFDVDLRTQGYTPGTPFYAGVSFDEAEVGYRESEFMFEGTAVSYVSTEALGENGFWSVQEADAAPYRSRLVVLRPERDEDFNGTAVVEWFNVSGGIDAAPDFTQMHTEIMREGYMWVGVSAQKAGIDGGGAFDLPLKQIDPERYSELIHPGDSFAYDIFSQAVQAVRSPVGLDPTGGLDVKRVIAVGQSQSAFYLTTYANAVLPLVDAVDGFIIHSRGDGSGPLSVEPQASAPTPDKVFTRTDLAEPVILLQTETDVFRLNSAAVRQEDSQNYRLWEVAGSAHSDVYTTLKGPLDRGDDPLVADVVSNNDARPPFISCALAVNDGPGHWVAKAALAAMDDWIRNGTPASSAQLLDLTPDGSTFALDEFGNVTGGIRTPYVDAPVATLSGEGQPSDSVFCGLFGRTTLFETADLDALYGTRQNYIDAIDTATDSAVDAGFLLPADAGLIKARARTSNIVSP